MEDFSPSLSPTPERFNQDRIEDETACVFEVTPNVFEPRSAVVGANGDREVDAGRCLTCRRDG